MLNQYNWFSIFFLITMLIPPSQTNNSQACDNQWTQQNLCWLYFHRQSITDQLILQESTTDCLSGKNKIKIKRIDWLEEIFQCSILNLLKCRKAIKLYSLIKFKILNQINTRRLTSQKNPFLYLSLWTIHCLNIYHILNKVRICLTRKSLKLFQINKTNKQIYLKIKLLFVFIIYAYCFCMRRNPEQEIHNFCNCKIEGVW